MTFCTKYFCRPKNKHEVPFKTGLRIAFVCQSVIECNYLYKFIRDASEIRNAS